MLDALILTGGLGTRLASAVPNLPKGLAPIQGIPFLRILLNQLKKSQIVSKAVLALRYKADEIIEELQSPPLPVEFSIEPSPLGTGGAILYALSKLSQSTLLVLNGDTFFDLPFTSLLNFHLEKKAELTIAARKVEDRSRYGSLQLDSSGRIQGYLEKSSSSGSGYISGGVYLIQRSLLDSIEPCPLSIETDLFPQWLSHKTYAYVHEGTFIDIGTPESYQTAQQLLKPWISP
ncbi:MAG: NTP transferase domain-containing protein [Verrucomicrobia bacterium]|nr:NTP transferase domain-containing protein [Verrucomicrobiota bacterium]